MDESETGSKADLPYGAYSRIARRVRPQVTAQHVREVWKGARKSARIERAIARFIEKERESA